MKTKNILLPLLIASLITGCKSKNTEFDASGTFEGVETIISSEANGVLKQFDIEEGLELRAGQYVGYVDSIQLYLKKKQLETQIKAVLSQRPNIPVQLAALQTQLKTAEKERDRFANLLKAEAATQKQVDDINAQIEVLKKQIEAQQSVLGTTSNSITEQTEPLVVQIEQLNDQLNKCKLQSPITGTVLSKYVEANEVVGIGKPMFKIADLSKLTLRAYISGEQLPSVKLGQKVKVLIDGEKGSMKEIEGVISWISDKAEFTPKTIQTKDERANLVYAIKINVKNDGLLKIGMYGEVKF